MNQMFDWLLALFSIGFERMERDRRRELQWIPDEDFRFGSRLRKAERAAELKRIGKRRRSR